MFQTSDIPVFQGSQSPQDSKEWLETLVACTGSFSDSGIFRLITTKLPPGSVARKWYDSLEGSVKKSWEDFEKKFRDRWIDENQRLVDQRAAWAAFTLHTLSEDAIFSGIALRSDDAGGIISSWVEEHIPLGMATTLDDATLIKATHVRLPPFIAAYMQLNHPSSSISFPDYCRSIAQIPSTNLHLEKIRRQISSKDQISKIEKKVEEIAEQLRRLTEATKPGELQALGEIRSHDDEDVVHDPNTEISSSESIAWEPCSPMSSHIQSSSTSEHATPTGHLIPLPQSLNNSNPHSEFIPQDEDTPPAENDVSQRREMGYDIPHSWRKPSLSMSRNDLIVVVQRAVNFLLTIPGALTQSQYYSSRLACVVIDNHLGVRSYKHLMPSSYYVSDLQYENLLIGIMNTRHYSTYEDCGPLPDAIRRWKVIAEDNHGNYDGMITASQSGVYTTSRSYVGFPTSAKESEVSVFAGGLFGPDVANGNVTISSTRTILFMTLSSYLAECTGQAKFKDVAILSANCIKRWMIDPATKLIKECFIDVLKVKEREGAVLSCHLTGMAIEGFHVLAVVSGDESWKSLANDIAVAAMRHNEWHTPDGILNVGSNEDVSKSTDNNMFKGWLNRGLLVAYQHNRTNEPFCNLIRGYINVQFNALYELSRYCSSYGCQWSGPYVGPYAHAQATAIDALVAAVGVNDI